MKKKLLSIVLMICIALAAIVGVVIYQNYNWFYTRLYFGNRVEGTYEVTVEGKKVEVDSVSYTLDGFDAKYKYDKETFSTKEGYYGLHKIGFNIANKKLYALTGDKSFINANETTIVIDYFNTNWWHIIKLDVKINMIKENGEWLFEVTLLDDDYPFTGQGYLWKGKTEKAAGINRIQFGP